MKQSSRELDFGRRGWLFIVYCFASFVVGGAFLGLWQITVTENALNLGWNSTAALSMTNLAGVIMCLLELWVSRRLMTSGLNISRLSVGALLLFAFSSLAMAFFTDDYFVFSLLFIVAYITSNGQSMLLNGILTGNWWPKRRGIVIGITTIGIPLGSAVGNGLYMALAALVGGHNVYIIYAAAGIVVSLIGAFFIRDFPEEVGAYPDNDQTLDREAVNREFAAMQELQKYNPWSMKRILSCPQTWIIILVGIVTFNLNGLYVVQSMNRLVIYGNMEMSAVLILLTIASIVACFGSPICGLIDEKISTKASAIFMCVLGIAATLLQMAGTYASVMAGMILVGVVMGGSSNVVVSLASDAWPRESSGRAFSVMQPVMHLITMGLNESYLLISGSMHSYTVPYWIFMILNGIALLFLFTRYNPEKVKELDREYKKESGYAGKFNEGGNL